MVRCWKDVLAGVIVLQLGQELVEEEIESAVVDEFVDHVVEVVFGGKVLEDGLECRAIAAEAGQGLGGEGTE